MNTENQTQEEYLASKEDMIVASVQNYLHEVEANSQVSKVLNLVI
jgi:hypothetical protein